MLSRKLHALLLLPLVAEPDPDDVLLEVQLLRDRGDLLAGWPRLHREVRLERAFLGRGDARPFPLLLAGRQDRGRVGVAPLVLRLGLRFLQPGREDRLEGDHVVVRERQRLEAADGRLREGADARQLEIGERLSHVGLRHAELDASLLESLGERLELSRIGVGVGMEARRDRRRGRGGHRRMMVRRMRHAPAAPAQIAVMMVVAHHAVHAAVDGGTVNARVMTGPASRALGHRRQGRHRVCRVQHVEALHSRMAHLERAN